MAKETRKSVTFTMKVSHLKMLDDYADEVQMTRTELLNKIIVTGLKFDRALEDAGVFDELFGDDFLESLAKAVEKKVAKRGKIALVSPKAVTYQNGEKVPFKKKGKK